MFRNCLMFSKCSVLNQVRLFSRSHRENVISFAWEKPDTGRIKLNFDGASRFPTRNASIGGVYRDHKGVFLLGYAERIGKATSSVAELIAAKRGLELALENGWLNIWIEGDAKVVVDLMTKGPTMRSEEDLRHAREISMMIPQLNDFNASHIYREGNKVADKFSKLGYRISKPKIWRDVPPDEVLKFLRHDAEGKVIVRKTRLLRKQ